MSKTIIRRFIQNVKLFFTICLNLFMAQNRKQKIRDLIDHSGLSDSKVSAKIVDPKTGKKWGRARLSYHMQKEEISQEVFDAIVEAIKSYVPIEQKNKDISGKQNKILNANQNFVDETHNHYSDPRLLDVLLSDITDLKKENQELKVEIKRLKGEIYHKKK